jgi:hypothetical protein
MNNNLLQLKIKSRLNKMGSNDYDNFECWQMVEAFNKAQNEWVRREAKKGEDSKHNIDDLQKVVKEIPLKGSNKNNFYESVPLPEDYLAGKRVSAIGHTKECTTPRIFKVYEGEEANLDDLLSDDNKKPSFEWGETFKTQIDNKIRIHTNGQFSIKEATLVYYRKPKQISFENCVNEYDEVTTNVECEFKDDIVELLIGEACSILAGDIESFNQAQRITQESIRNN